MASWFACSTKEHEPAHFHVEHGGQHAKVDFAGNITAGAIASQVVRWRASNH
jgi:hypothetical protein